MPSLSLRAHYDGERVQLDEPLDLPPNTPLLVTVLPTGEVDGDQVEWLNASKQALVRAFADEEPEYTLADLQR